MINFGAASLRQRSTETELVYHFGPHSSPLNKTNLGCIPLIQ